MKTSLLDKARNITINERASRRFSKEELELALAWLNGELRLSQVSRAMGLPTSAGSYCFLATAAREIFQGKYDEVTND